MRGPSAYCDSHELTPREAGGRTAKGRMAMDATIRYQLAKTRMADLQAEAAAERLARLAAPKRRRGVGTTLSGLGRLVSRLVLGATTRRVSAMRSGTAQGR